MTECYPLPRVPGPVRSRLRCTPTSVFDRDGRQFRGGVVWRVDGDYITLRLQASHNLVRDVIVARGLFGGTDASLALGSPIAARIAWDGVGEIRVLAVKGARSGHGESDEAGLVAKGLFYPGILNGCVAGCYVFQDESKE